MPGILQPDGLKNDQAYPAEVASTPADGIAGWTGPESNGVGVSIMDCDPESPTPIKLKWKGGAVKFGSHLGAACADPTQLNIGATTTGVFTGYSCQTIAGGECPSNGAILNSKPSFFTPAGIPGYQNLLIAVSTDAGGHITSSFAFYTHEYEVLQGLFGFDTPYEAWDGGTLTLAGAVQADSLVVNTINVKSNGVIGVNLYSIGAFDATQATDVTFGTATDIKHNAAHVGDLNGDGVDDITMHVRNKDAGVACGDTTVSLTGNTGGGDPFSTPAAIVLAGC
jgi:hypothetical protein